MKVVCTAGFKQARCYKKQHYLLALVPLRLATYNERTNMIKESPLRFLLTLKPSHETTTCSISMFNQGTAFFWKINLKSKYITCYPKRSHLSQYLNPTLQSLTSPHKKGKGAGRMLWTLTKIKVPINDIAKIT